VFVFGLSCRGCDNICVCLIADAGPCGQESHHAMPQYTVNWIRVVFKLTFVIGIFNE
jgi:hypothetical protein